MFINLSNHNSHNWTDKQKKCANQYGEIIDIQFPAVDPRMQDDQLDELVNMYYGNIMQYKSPVVMVQGEFTFTYRLVNKLKKEGIQVLAACSERIVTEVENEDGTLSKKSVFDFVGFRKY